MHHPIVGAWSKNIVEELGLDLVQTTSSSVVSPGMSSETTSTESPSASGTSTANNQKYWLIALIVSTLFSRLYI